MPRVALANRDPRRIVISASGKRVKPERAEQQRKHQRIAWKVFEMRFRAGQGRCRLLLDKRSDDGDVLRFTPRRVSRQCARMRGTGARLAGLPEYSMHARPRDMREREVRVFRNGAVERLASATPCGEDQIDAFTVECS